MIRQLKDLYLNNLNQTTQTMHQMWTDTLKSHHFLKSMRLFQIYYFEAKEKNDRIMEDWLETSRVASKEDVRDLVDAQRLVIDLLEDITDRLEKLEQTSKQIESHSGASAKPKRTRSKP